MNSPIHYTTDATHQEIKIRYKIAVICTTEAHNAGKNMIGVTLEYRRSLQFLGEAKIHHETSDESTQRSLRQCCCADHDSNHSHHPQQPGGTPASGREDVR